MVEVKRKKGESFEGLYRRFSKRLQQSGKMIEARKYRAYEEDKSKNMRQQSALRRIEIAKKRAYLEKVGKLVEEPKRR